RQFLAQFPNISADTVAEPCDPAAFTSCKLDWSEFERNTSAVALHRDLIALRRGDPVFRAQKADALDGAVLGPEAFVLRFFGERGDDRLLFVNSGPDIHRDSFPEPLIAPPEGRNWRLLWSSEEMR